MSNQKTKDQAVASVFGEPRSHEEVLSEIRQNRQVYEKYLELPDKMKQQVVGFLAGERSLNILYDNFFRKIFNPEEHKGRVEKLISALIGQNVKIKAVLSREGSQITDKGSFVIMDIIVELQDGSFVDVEMQKTGYRFPSQRSSCYVSDMIMRQYNRRKEESGNRFSYKEITPVYLFVLMEQSSDEFVKSSEYIHKRQVYYSSGIVLDEAARITYITLDSFSKNVQNVDDELNAWLSFLIKDDIESVIRLTEAHPEFGEMYQEIAEFRRDPEELIGMFSEALYIMDRNTEKYMVDELKEKVKLAEQELEQVRQEVKTAKQEFKAAKQETEAAKQETEAAKQETEAAKQETEAAKQETEAEKKRADSAEKRVRELEAVISGLEKQ